MQHRIETKVGPDRIIVLDNLPFQEGEMVEVIVIPHQGSEQGRREYPLRGKPILYDNPFSTVAEDDWNALS
jgi:hypothetical protein